MTITRDVGTLESRTAPIDMGSDGFRAAGHKLVDRIADWLAVMPDGPVTRNDARLAGDQARARPAGHHESGKAGLKD
jgi:hypothetical protein